MNNSSDSKEIQEYSSAAKIWAAMHHGELTARSFNRLLSDYGSVERLLSAEAAELQERFEFVDEIALKIAAAETFLEQSEAFFKSLAIRNIEYVTILDSNYPEGFRELNDPPPLVFFKGKLPQSSARAVALVGCSESSQEGISVAVDFGSRAAAAGVTLVSGLTKGVDSSALVGAVTADGSACAVALSGLENLYPDDAHPVFEQVIANGCVFSEYSPELEFIPENDGEANRLITALSQAVVIGEVGAGSLGTLDIAKSCVELGKLLFILIPSEVPIHDEKALEPFVALGAVPISYPDDMNTILKCLV